MKISPQRLEHLYKTVSPRIKEKDTKFQKAISPEQQIVITLRFLASGQPQQSVSCSYRVGKAAV